jgi:hypothetical protein
MNNAWLGLSSAENDASQSICPRFEGADEWDVSKVIVAGPRGDSDQRAKQIGSAERFDSAVQFEFLEMDGREIRNNVAITSFAACVLQ